EFPASGRLGGRRHCSPMQREESLSRTYYSPVCCETKENSRIDSETATAVRSHDSLRLFDPDHHRVRTNKMGNVDVFESDFLHPCSAICTAVIESAGRFD